MLTINNTLDGYLKDVEIKGNTIQDIENLADIRSVGDKVEGQELYEIPVLSRGKNLFNIDNISSNIISKSNDTYEIRTNTPVDLYNKGIFKAVKNVQYTVSYKAKLGTATNFRANFVYTDGSVQQFSYCNSTTEFIQITATSNMDKQLDYIRFNWTNAGTVYIKDIQIEEGTVATPYEPYQEDKLTILSPVQLEKVGDVADRIIEKDGVWGVEKNIGTVVLDGSETDWKINQSSDSDIVFLHSISSQACNPINDKFIFKSGTSEKIVILNDADLYFRISKARLSTQDVTGFKQWLRENPTLVKHITIQPQFIPLPHDQQVKLRTFANKTNISFLTEIEGTIKAQVPKSLGATVNTHTEQISNLNKELDRVKKLEESTISTVTTESDFTTVEATSNGYFEDVKLEGKTLVNLLKNVDWINNDAGKYIYTENVIYNPVGETVTFINLSDKQIEFAINNSTNLGIAGDYAYSVLIDAFSSKVINIPSEHGIRRIVAKYEWGWTIDDASTIKNKMVLLKGTHSNINVSHFEGLKSVGDGADEIVVSSVKGDGNLWDGTYELGSLTTEEGVESNTGTNRKRSNFIPICGDHLYLRLSSYSDTSSQIIVHIYDTDYKLVSFIDGAKYKVINSNNVFEYTLPSNAKYLRFRTQDNATLNNDTIMISSKEIIEYTPHQSDKKRLLYYNEETQTWEKPILRQWDSIEKHADGKYYYHQRSGEVVLNGSENWVLYNSNINHTFSAKINHLDNMLANSLVSVCDKFSYLTPYDDIWNNDTEGLSITQTALAIRIDKTKLSTQDIQGFKQWLQANNVTVVYQLAEEKVYECTNIDLITYANETNYIVESGAIVPKSTLKVHNNISNVVSLLQKKVSLLESNMTKYMITQNRMQLASTYSADSVTFKVDYALCSEEVEYNEDLYNLILNNILVGKDNYNYDKMFNMILDYASWNQISWEQFDILVGLMDIQHNPPIEEIPTDDEIVEEIPNEIM